MVDEKTYIILYYAKYCIAFFGMTEMANQLDVIPWNQTLNLSDIYGLNGTSDSPVSDLQFLKYLWIFITPVLFGLIILIGSFGNLFVIYVILKNNMMKNLNNILLMNLAIADILFLWTCLPFQAYKFAAFYFPMGNIVCKLIQYSLYLTAYVTVWTLVAIAALRYLSIVKSSCTLHIRTKKNVTLTCVALWVILMIANVPTVISHRINTLEQLEYCGLVPQATKYVLVTFFIFAYTIPLMIIAVLYVLISHYLCYQTSQSSQLSRRIRRRIHREKAIKTVTVVVIVFAVSWLPLHMHSLYSVYWKLPSSTVYEVWRVLWYCMAYGNSLANPLIYNFTSEEFKKAFRGQIGCCKGYTGMLLRLRRSSHPSTRACRTSSMVTVHKTGEDV